MTRKENKQVSQSRPPIIAVLGHVDHGKTTLLDAIRKTTVAEKEHGGITQHIGAYQIMLPQVTGSTRFLTFIDTPGHEAFAAMRSRGATAADIALLVVAADDSVKPQTKESINQIKAAGIPMIVVVNKIDTPGANIEKVKKDLAKESVQVEGFGGDIPIVPISAKQGTGLKELVEMIALVWEMNPVPSVPGAPLESLVIETRVDKGRGMVATLLVKKGTLRMGLTLFSDEKQVGKVRAMFDEHGGRVDEALPGKPVETLGFVRLPQVGSVISDTPKAGKQAVPAPSQKTDALPDFLKPVSNEPEGIKIVLKTDTAGSMEAIITSLPSKVTVVGSGIGDVSEADILFAKSSGALVIGFQVKARAEIEKLAQAEKVVYRLYSIIYELLDELNEVVAGLREVVAKERELGGGKVIAEFPFDNAKIAGTKITSGRLVRGDTVKILRGEEEVGRAKIKSIRRGKDDIGRVEQGNECGILFDRPVDFLLNDVIIAVTQS